MHGLLRGVRGQITPLSGSSGIDNIINKLKYNLKIRHKLNTALYKKTSMDTHNRGARGYSAHFKLQAKKDRLEYILNKLHPVKMYLIYCRFYPSLQKAKNVYCIVTIKYLTK
jgi:hypothetical protein